jgi:RecA-family ATPase
MSVKTFQLTEKDDNRADPKVFSASYIRSLAKEQPEDILSGLIRQGEQLMLFSSPGAGKSWLALGLALAAANGTAVARTKDGQEKWKAPKPRNVLWVDGELDAADISQRVSQLTRSYTGLGQDPLGPDFLSKQMQSLDSQFPDISKPRNADDLVRYCTTNRVDLVILDNLTTLASLDDENTTSAFKPIIENLLMRLKQARVACVLVHHSNKNDSSYRGSSSIATTFNAIIHLKKNRLEKGEFSLEFQKARNTHIENTATTFKLSEKSDATGLCLECDGAISKRETVVALVKTLEFKTDQEVRLALAEKSGGAPLPTSTFSDLKRSCIAAGLIAKSEWDKCLLEAGELADLPEL